MSGLTKTRMPFSHCGRRHSVEKKSEDLNLLNRKTMLRVIDVDYIKEYKLALTFNDGKKKVVDLQSHLTGEVFGELMDKSKFVQYALTPVTIEWANGADLAPEFLYEIGAEA